MNIPATKRDVAPPPADWPSSIPVGVVICAVFCPAGVVDDSDDDLGGKVVDVCHVCIGMKIGRAHV